MRLLTYTLADELGPEIRVNAIHPGLVDTAMVNEDVPILGTEAGEAYRETIPAKRFAEPEEIADAIAFLASPQAEYITGHVLRVDGGLGM